VDRYQHALLIRADTTSKKKHLSGFALIPKPTTNMDTHDLSFAMYPGSNGFFATGVWATTG